VAQGLSASCTCPPALQAPGEVASGEVLPVIFFLLSCCLLSLPPPGPTVSTF
jgi:hypothetical protein